MTSHEAPSSHASTDADGLVETPPGEEFWLFGYGSLIWKPPPHFDKRIPGWVTGYVRRFWQASQDHRGTPEAPGRVVTLIERSFWSRLADPHPSVSDKVWGVAYRIEPARVTEVKEYLDIREINGYSIHYTDFHPAATTADHHHHDHPSEAAVLPRALVYIGTPDNDQFVGPQDPHALAAHIARSAGPSGPNRDYLLQLEAALERLSPDSGDEHVSDLARRLRDIEAAAQLAVADVNRAVDGSGKEQHQQQPPAQSHAVAGPEAFMGSHPPVNPSFHKVTSIDEQEETEKNV